MTAIATELRLMANYSLAYREYVRNSTNPNCAHDIVEEDRKRLDELGIAIGLIDPEELVRCADALDRAGIPEFATPKASLSEWAKIIASKVADEWMTEAELRPFCVKVPYHNFTYALRYAVEKGLIVREVNTRRNEGPRYKRSGA